LKSKKKFTRTTETGCDEILILFVDHLHYHVNFSFDKRIDRIQKIVTAVEYENGFNAINNYKEHATIGVTYGNIVGKRNIEIVSYSILEKELPKVLVLIENEVIPYFDKLNSVEFLHQTLNYPEKENNIFSLKGFDDRVITGLIIAKLLNDPNYDNLFNAHIKKYPENQIMSEKLMKLNEYLKIKELKVDSKAYYDNNANETWEHFKKIK
jgi:hypothetical protein